jgi:uncharacterized protein (TIGR03435 family)
LEAKAAGDPRGPEIHRMIQALLADRIQLKLRRETRELPVYWLVVGKNGPKILRATDETRSYRASRGLLNTRTTMPALANVYG